MTRTRLPEESVEARRAVLQLLPTLFSAAALKPCLPKLRYRGRAVAEVYEHPMPSASSRRQSATSRGACAADLPELIANFLLRRLLDAANDAAKKAASKILPTGHEVLMWASDKFVQAVMQPLYGLLPPDDPSAWAQLVAGGQPALERLVRLEPFEAVPQPAIGPPASAGPAVPPVGAPLGRCSTPPPCRPQGTPERRRPPSPPPDASKSPAGRAAQGRGAISPMRPQIPMEAAYSGPATAPKGKAKAAAAGPSATECEPTRSRTQVASAVQGLEALPTGHQLEAVGAKMDLADLALILRGAVAANAECIGSVLGEALPPEVAQSVVTQLLMREIGTPAASGGECAPPQAASERAPPRATALRAPPARPLTASVLKALPREEQLDMLDVLGEQLLPPDEAGCLRDCVLALDRIRAYKRPAEGGKIVRMANFLRSILQAVARGGMALDTMTTWAFFYGARPWDDAHRDVSSNNLSWTVDGGFYMDALRDLKWVGGERVLQMARGPFHSGMLKSEEVRVNDYKIARDFGEQEQVPVVGSRARLLETRTPPQSLGSIRLHLTCSEHSAYTCSLSLSPRLRGSSGPFCHARAPSAACARRRICCRTRACQSHSQPVPQLSSQGLSRWSAAQGPKPRAVHSAMPSSAAGAALHTTPMARPIS